jgi:hypothetical protein
VQVTVLALALWRGPAMADIGEFAAPYALRLDDLRLDDLRLQATADWLEGELQAGRAAGHVAELKALAVGNPLNEKVTALLMRALAGQADVLAHQAGLGAHVEAVHPGGALIRPQQRGQDAHRGGLADAVAHPIHPDQRKVSPRCAARFL